MQLWCSQRCKHYQPVKNAIQEKKYLPLNIQTPDLMNLYLQSCITQGCHSISFSKFPDFSLNFDRFPDRFGRSILAIFIRRQLKILYKYLCVLI